MDDTEDLQMPHEQLDRSTLNIKPLATRVNKTFIERDCVRVGMAPDALTSRARETVVETAQRMRAARQCGYPIMLAFGAHTIKNGLGPVLIRMIEDGWLQHLATNGAGIIHDWEFAFQGQTSEDVAAYVAQGQFGIWEETGHHLNLAIALGAGDGLGYGESVGRLINQEQHVVPSRDELHARLSQAGESAAAAASAAGAADLLALLMRFDIPAGTVTVPHPWKSTSVQATAFRLGVPFTGHPMFGHDIIYTHPLNCGAAIGRAAQRDFLAYAHQVSQIDGGVYLSIGSAVMSPMIFEKSLSMAQNLALQHGRRLDRYFIAVVDLAESHWDWNQGEPPTDSPDYYLRYCKTFSRMGGTMRYATVDNRDFLLALCAELGVACE